MNKLKNETKLIPCEMRELKELISKIKTKKAHDELLYHLENETILGIMDELDDYLKFVDVYQDELGNIIARGDVFGYNDECDIVLLYRVSEKLHSIRARILYQESFINNLVRKGYSEKEIEISNYVYNIIFENIDKLEK